MVEIVCGRLARKNNIPIPQQFWSKDASEFWQKEFKSQLREANALLKLYDELAIFAALRVNSWVFTLRMKRFKDMVEVEQAKLDRVLTAPEIVQPIVDLPQSSTPANVKPPNKSTRAKLRGL